MQKKENLSRHEGSYVLYTWKVKKIKWKHCLTLDLFLLKGVFLFYGTNNRVTAMFPSGAGVEVRGQGKFLSTNILLPEEFINQTQGLMGVMNNNPNDDLMLRDGNTFLTNSTSEQLFQFGADCKYWL